MGRMRVCWKKPWSAGPRQAGQGRRRRQVLGHRSHRAAPEPTEAQEAAWSTPPFDQSMAAPAFAAATRRACDLQPRSLPPAEGHGTLSSLQAELSSS